MIFVENLKFIHLFIFVQNRPGKGVKRYSRTKQGIPDYQNERVKKSKNWDFSKGVSPWFWSKLSKFSMFLF